MSVALGVVFGALAFLWSSRSLFVGMGATAAAGYIGGSLLIAALPAYLICYGCKKLKPA